MRMKQEGYGCTLYPCVLLLARHFTVVLTFCVPSACVGAAATVGRNFGRMFGLVLLILVVTLLGSAGTLLWFRWPATARRGNARAVRQLLAAVNSAGGGGSPRSAAATEVLLVCAHPDDEAMFFSPTLDALKGAGFQLRFLCFSSGNYDGLGAVRKKELENSAAMYGATTPVVVEDARTQDGPTPWDTPFIAQYVVDFVDRHAAIGAVITFDAMGVSGHSNHRDVHRGVSLAASSPIRGNRGVCFFELQSRPMWRKYTGPLELLALDLGADTTPAGRGVAASPLRFVVRPRNALLSFDGMKAHASQLVWFRYLFVFFSQYGFLNELRPLKPSTFG
jgi:N-acetylglucosaminylphosphatidylinositol deacetylase